MKRYISRGILFAVLVNMFCQVHAQTLDGCNLQDDQWQILFLNEDSGSKTLDFVYDPCMLDLTSDLFVSVDIENSAPVDLIADIRCRGQESWKYNEGRSYIPANSTKSAKMLLYREKPDASSPWMDEFSEIRALPGGHVIHWRAYPLEETKRVKVTISWKGLNGQVSMVKVKTPVGDGAYIFPDISFDQLPRPLLDEMGQLVNEDWDDKLDSRSELVSLGSQDTSTFLHAGVKQEFSRYGGWKNGPKLTATGRFYATKYEDKWWLVDPEGYLFWSQGVTGTGKGVETLTSGRASLFPDFADEKTGELWSILEEETLSGKINFYMMNVKRKYGSDWDSLHAAVTQGRMKSWGLNTYAAWSDIPENIEHPYTLIIHPTKQGIGSIEKMVDPFSSSFVNSLKSYLASLSNKINDPWNLGIFVNNELHWNNKNNIPNQVLELSSGVPARAAMEQFLSDKYGDIGSLNASWNSSFTSFGDVSGSGSESFSETFREDMDAYLDHFADTYYRTCKEEVENALPGTLYLGSRLHGSSINNPIVTRAASRHCDVISLNYYHYSPGGISPEMETDKPIIIGEFHFGTGSHGVWGVGLVPATDLENQAAHYKQYIADALEHEHIVGAHWFQWSDQVVTGRKDGENYRIGLVDVTDQPYTEMITAISETSMQLYPGGSSTVFPGEKLTGTANSEINIYPNPNEGSFFVRLPDKDTQTSLSLVSLIGEQVFRTTLDDDREIVLPGHIRGLHVLLVQLEGEIHAKKMMIH